MNELHNFINLSAFDLQYNSDSKQWLENEVEFINLFLDGKDKDKYIREVNGELWTCKELAIKYAQTLDPKLEIACIKVLGSFFNGYEDIEGSIFSFRFHCKY
jgi:hypothetical protein